MPFVEGALAEPDRREVQEHLPACQACTQEVRALKEAVQMLRSSGLSFRSELTLTPDEVIDYALSSDQMPSDGRRRLQLALIEQLEAQQEIEMLRELEQELAAKGEPARVPDGLSPALKAAVAETYGTALKKSKWETRLEPLWALFATFNPRPVIGAAAVLLLFGLGAQAVYRGFSSDAPKSGSVAVTETQTKATAAAPALPSPVVLSATPSNQVALLQGKVHPDDLPRLSRLLWEKKVSHTYRDGQIYVAPEDVKNAWGALRMNEERLAAQAELKTGAVAEDAKKREADGSVAITTGPRTAGFKAGAGSRVPAGIAAEASPSLGSHAPAIPGSADSYVRSNSTGGAGTPPPRPVARSPVSAPPLPPPVETPAKATLPAAEPVASTVAAKRPAAPVTAPAPPPPPVASKAAAPPPKKPDATTLAKDSNVARDNKEVAQQYIPPAGGYTEDALRRKSAPAPAPVASASASGRAKGADELAPPKQQESSYQVNQLPAQLPRDLAYDKQENQPVVNAQTAPEYRADRPERQMPEEAAAPPDVPSGFKPVPRLEDRDRSASQERARTASQKAAPPIAQGMVLRGEAPGAPANSLNEEGTLDRRDSTEVAMLQIAKRVVMEAIGVEAAVKVERKDDGSVVVTVRPERALTAAETETLRKVLRKRLNLEEADSVVIRQP